MQRQAMIKDVENSHGDTAMPQRNLRRRQPDYSNAASMIDNFSLGLTHFLLLYAAWRMLSRPDLDSEETDVKSGWGRK
jgi:hypothetical protein